MWMILGLMAALLGGAAADAMISTKSYSWDEDEENEGSDATEDADAPRTGGLADLIPAVPISAAVQTPLAVGNDPDVPGLTEQDADPIHSSDTFPEPAPSLPLFLASNAASQLLQGGARGDVLIGGSGQDSLYGAGGDDLLIAGPDGNCLIGGEGDDTLAGSNGPDTLQGGWGDDLLIAGGGASILNGGAGNDILVGVVLDGAGRDVSGPSFLNGGDGDDLLIAGAGDHLNGGSGADIFALGHWLAGNNPATIVDFDATEDQIVLTYPAADGPPDVAVTHDPAKPGLAQIHLAGKIIALVQNAPDLRVSDISLRPLPDLMTLHRTG